MNTSNWTGKTPRDLSSAFGPYTSQQVEPMPSKPSKLERIADRLFAIALGLICAAGLVSWLVR